MAEAPTPEEIKTWIKATYDAASDHFDDPKHSFWNEVGTRTVELAGAEPGARVLDVCCGTGASALPAAHRVGPSGEVVGMDFAERLLELARRKASDQGLQNVTFEPGDMTDLPYPSGSFSVVICVFGIFFAPDQPAALAGLWDRVAPGGLLAITTWGKRCLEPGNTIFWESVDAVRPDLTQKTPPWLTLSTPEGLAELFAQAGLPQPQIVPESLGTRLSPEDYWMVVQGSGYRGVVDQMAPGEAAGVKDLILSRLAAESDGVVVSDVLYATAVKPN